MCFCNIKKNINFFLDFLVQVVFKSFKIIWPQIFLEKFKWLVLVKISCFDEVILAESYFGISIYN